MHQRRWVPARAAVVVVVAVLLQLSLVSDLRIAGSMGDLVLVVVVAAGITGGADRGATYGFAAGLVYDLLVASPFGLTALTYAIVGYVVGLLATVLQHTGGWWAVGMAAGAGVLQAILFTAFGNLVGTDYPFGDVPTDGPRARAGVGGAGHPRRAGAVVGARAARARPARGGAAMNDADCGEGRGHVPRLRLSLVAVVAVALFASLFARLYDLQVVGSDKYQVQAEANRVRTVQVPAPRGRILDRNGKVVVDNRVAVVVGIDRSVLGELPQERQDEVLWRLSVELSEAGHPTDADVMRQQLTDDRFSRYAPVPVALDVPEELKIYLEEHPDEYPGVVVERTAMRTYPYGPLAAHILGYVGKINDEELALVADEAAKPYTLNDEIGKSGVEQTYERYLRGTPGLRRIEVDAQGDPVRVISERPPSAGDDLVLAIDVDVQALAEQKVQQGLADARARPNRDGSRNNGTTGSAVVIDPNNGQIIAMASYPSYDPNIAADGFTQAEYAALQRPGQRDPAEQLGHPGAVGTGVDLQALHRLRRARWRA